MKRYVLGFRFDDRGRSVLLTEKTHPSWQAGKWNGIGGHVEEGEEYDAAMVREGAEECGQTLEWDRYAVMRGADWECHVYRSFGPHFRVSRANDAGEPLFWMSTTVLHDAASCIDNLSWLIPLALRDRNATAEVLYA